jgi:hypothetical protein
MTVPTEPPNGEYQIRERGALTLPPFLASYDGGLC